MDGNQSRNNDLIGEINRRRITDEAFHILIVLYSVLIIFGAAGNSLVVLVVARKPAMRTARNMFILNLAISDLLLCLVTMPLTLIEIQAKYWPFGTDVVLCKLIETLRAISIFVSTISITAIALDRYQVIVYPTRDNLQKMGAVGILVGIWLLSILLSSPMFFVKRLEVRTSEKLQLLGIPYVAYCVEDWRGITNGRAYYSAISLFVQYLLPIFIVSAAYMRIYFKLKTRMPLGNRPASVNAAASERSNLNGATQTTVQTTTTTPAIIESGRDKERDRRMRRTNYLLISIAAIFGISWLPLNIFNLIAELDILQINETFFVIYAVCHMMGMSSACSNPLLYGWLNDNFRKEFNEILCKCQCKYCCDASSIRGGRHGMHRHKRSGENSKVGLNVDDNNMKFESGVVTENGLQTELTVLVR